EGLLTQENFALVANNIQHDITSIIILLHQAGILRPENHPLITLAISNAGSVRRELVSAFTILQKAGMLTQGNLKLVANNSRHIFGLDDALFDLQQGGILTQENFAFMVENIQFAFG